MCGCFVSPGFGFLSGAKRPWYGSWAVDDRGRRDRSRRLAGFEEEDALVKGRAARHPRSDTQSSVHMLLQPAARLPASLVQLLATAHPAPLCRRQLLSGAAVAASSVAARPARAAETVSRDEAVERILGRVPCFAVANQAGMPYLTDINAAGKRSGSIYLGLREAAAVLEEVRVFDENATLAVVPLSSVYPTAAKTTAELERQFAVVPQPNAGTSMDMRLFRLRPLADEKTDVAQEVASVPGSVPLYYVPDLFLTVDGEQRRPFFFRLRDLEETWARRPGGRADPRAPPVRVLGLERLLAQLEGGDAPVQPILMPASETAELVQGRTLQNKGPQPRE